MPTASIYDIPVRKITGAAASLAEHKGKEMVGMGYEPLYPLVKDGNDKAYKVYTADFVNTTEGTGVVHTAVLYGEDDYALGLEAGIGVAWAVSTSWSLILNRTVACC